MHRLLHLWQDVCQRTPPVNTFYNAFDYECAEPRTSGSDVRNIFQIDRDRVLFSYAFRRLQSKTQVFQSGEYDFYRTRLTHTIEVARIARSITDALRSNSSSLNAANFFIDPDLVEGLGYAHDIGHPPFGHIGERKLNELMAPYGGFEGNAQTLRILTNLIFERRDGPRGMNPSRAFVDGVLKYKALHGEWLAAGQEPENHFLYDDQASVRDFVFKGADTLPATPGEWNALKSIECQIMDWADDAAYSLHDIVDGVRAGFLTAEAIEKWASRNAKPEDEEGVKELCKAIRGDSLEKQVARKIGEYINACTLKPSGHPLATLSNRYAYNLVVDSAVAADSRLKKRIAFDIIFQSCPIQQTEFRGGVALDRLFSAYQEHYIEPASGVRILRILPELVERQIHTARDAKGRARIICDYLSSLTDAQAVRACKRLYEPGYGSLSDLL